MRKYIYINQTNFYSFKYLNNHDKTKNYSINSIIHNFYFN